jgi:hypothetical protein
VEVPATLDVLAGNAAPTAVDDAYTVEAGETLTVDAPGPASNDTDPDGDGLTWRALNDVSNGTLSVPGDGGFQYAPNDGFTGTDGFRYEVSDGNGGFDEGQVTIDVTAPTVTSIADARSQGTGTAVTVEGIVTRAFGDFVRIQDSSGPTGASGIVVRQTTGAFVGEVADGTIRRGTRIRVTATVSEFNGQFQLNEADVTDYQIVDQGALPPAQAISLADLAERGEEYESELVRITGLEFVDASGSTLQNRTSYTVTDDGGATTLLFRVQNERETDIGGAPRPTGAFTYTGIVGEFRGDPQLVPIRQTDIAVEAAPRNAVDGRTSDPRYILLGTSPAEPGAGFSEGIVGLKAYSGPDSLFIAVEGKLRANQSDDSYQEIIVFLNASSTDGVAAGTPLPSGSDGPSPFRVLDGMRMDIETDVGIRVTGANDARAFVSVVDYTIGAAQAPDRFEATLSTAGEASRGGELGGQYAYRDAPSLSAVSDTGFEVALPYSALGTTRADTYQLFAFYGDIEGNRVAATVIPDDNATTTYSNSQDWTAVPGIQATGAQVLPVELTGFAAALDGSTAVLNWTTASEASNAGFEVQHAMGTAAPFATRGFVEGAGTTTDPHTYRFRVPDLSPGAHRFRLRQVDLDGTSTLSEGVAVRVEAERALTLALTGPNPAGHATRLAFTVAQEGDARVALYNVLGQEVRQVMRRRAQVGQVYDVAVPTAGLASGVYFARLMAPGGARTLRLVVVN